jgi:hypothetical protein
LNHTITIPFEQQDGSTSDLTEAVPAAIAADTALLLGLWAYGDQTLFDDEIAALKSAIFKIRHNPYQSRRWHIRWHIRWL